MASESAQGTASENAHGTTSESAEGTTAVSPSTLASKSGQGTTTEVKKVVLRTSDGQEFEMEEKIIAEMSGTIKGIVEDGCADSAIPLPEVTSAVLVKVIAYCQQHGDATADAEELKAFDKEFVKMERDEMFAVLMAANYLHCRPLLDLTCQAVADTIKDMTVEQARDYFGIENDFTHEEEAKIRAENAWAFDD